MVRPPNALFPAFAHRTRAANRRMADIGGPVIGLLMASSRRHSRAVEHLHDGDGADGQMVGDLIVQTGDHCGGSEASEVLAAGSTGLPFATTRRALEMSVRLLYLLLGHVR